MRKTDLEAVRAVVQRVRSTRFPDLDADFIDAVLDSEATAPDDDVSALRDIRDAARASLATAGRR